MGVIRSVVWTVGALGVGMALATVEVGGRTPLAHAQSAWRRSDAGEWLRERADDAVDRARGALGQSQRPRERHTDEDRAALDRIIAKRSSH
ncbi:MAG TPA: hypothetical protein VLQ79_13185 [Myxococcaceae bacterium]|nr:hypothetical protein [Myxococcaceae bacterium]